MHCKVRNSYLMSWISDVSASWWWTYSMDTDKLVHRNYWPWTLNQTFEKRIKRTYSIESSYQTKYLSTNLELEHRLMELTVTSLFKAISQEHPLCGGPNGWCVTNLSSEGLSHCIYGNKSSTNLKEKKAKGKIKSCSLFILIEIWSEKLWGWN